LIERVLALDAAAPKTRTDLSNITGTRWQTRGAHS
jgi:hypothetical protein